MDDGVRYELTRCRLSGGEETTVYVIRHPVVTTAVRVVCFAQAQRLDHWCAEQSVSEAIVAGFFSATPCDRSARFACEAAHSPTSRSTERFRASHRASLSRPRPTRTPGARPGDLEDHPALDDSQVEQLER